MSGTPLPALNVTGIRVAHVGTAIWAVLAVIAFVFPDLCAQIGIVDAREISVAGVILGAIGTVHVTRRAKKLR